MSWEPPSPDSLSTEAIPNPQYRGFADWYDQVEPALIDAEQEGRRILRQFSEAVQGSEQDPSPTLLRIESRIKKKDRLFEKILRKEMLGKHEQILLPPFPIKDVVGLRMIVRGLSDLEVFAERFQGDPPLEMLEDSFDDKIMMPTETGYRALHCDTVVTVERYGSPSLTVPIELQVKTAAQDAWGYYTHDSSYSLSDLRNDARFLRVRNLHRTLAAHLHAIDESLQEIEFLARDAAEEISQIAADGMNYATVMNVVADLYAERLSPDTCRHFSELAKFRGVETPEALRARIATDNEDLVGFSEVFRAEHGRPPRAQDILAHVFAP